MVEKFLPEREGRFYYLRSYAFFSDQGLAVRSRSDRPVVKGVNGADLEYVPVDPAILSAREELGFDYGKFDYVLHDGKAILIDINNTPTFGNAYSPSVRREISRSLAEGISRWVE